jgi:hypothetical protein
MLVPGMPLVMCIFIQLVQILCSPLASSLVDAFPGISRRECPGNGFHHPGIFSSNRPGKIRQRQEWRELRGASPHVPGCRLPGL